MIRHLAALSSVALSILPLVAATSARAAAPSGNVAYYGGHVISHVQVVPVMWGPNVAAEVVSSAQPFFSMLVNSPYMDWLGEYDTAGLKGKADGQPGSNQHVNRGTVLPNVTITPANGSTSLTDPNIQAELLAQLKAGKLPPPKIDPEGGVDTLYVIAFPSGIKVSDFSGSDTCTGGCAYHWTVTAPGVSSGVPYAVIPNCGPSSNCDLGNELDTFTGDCAHELMEAVTDTECALDTSSAVQRPLGWVDAAATNGGEIGDICLSDPAAWQKYQGYTVQTIWSQRLGKCITSDPSLGLCDGHTRPCRPCSAADCATCDTDMGSPTWGQCAGGSGSSSGSSSSGGSTSSSGSSSGGGSSGSGSSGASSSSGGASSGGSGSGGTSSGATSSSGGSSGSGDDGNGSDGGSSGASTGCAIGEGATQGGGVSWLALLAGLTALVLARTRRAR